MAPTPAFSCFAIVLLLLLGNNNFIAFGLTSVEVSIKNINNKNTKSDIDAVLNAKLLLFLVWIAMTKFINENIRMQVHEANP